jgi:hypothetical protein
MVGSIKGKVDDLIKDQIHQTLAAALIVTFGAENEDDLGKTSWQLGPRICSMQCVRGHAVQCHDRYNFISVAINFGNKRGVPGID